MADAQRSYCPTLTERGWDDSASPPVMFDTSCPAEVSLSSIVAISPSPLEKRFPDTPAAGQNSACPKTARQNCFSGVVVKRRAAAGAVRAPSRKLLKFSGRARGFGLTPRVLRVESDVGAFGNLP